MKPILFNTEMVRAILEGRKKVTRRVILWDTVNGVLASSARKNCPDITDAQFVRVLCDCRYHVGDILYVREKWSVDAPPIGKGQGEPVYAADYTERELVCLAEKKFRWKPSIHMPKDMARIFLRVTDVSVERLNQITADGALMEGIAPNQEPMPLIRREQYYRGCFAALWDTTTNNRDMFGWDANPWVWVVRFERVEKPEVEECSK